mmetsp:Transcript_648/g.1540  ORF Transcript_648/g.1540 Transcript_648/m.1540 type:complete len:296 (-) Transcript_648:293-1180(-)
MPLIVICGNPCTGKSTVARALYEKLEQFGHDVVIVDEPSLHLDRNCSYKDSRSEKEARGSLKSMVERMVSKKKYVIFDSLNNIKGYRYELWCIARAAGTRYCVLHCIAKESTSRQWNKQRRSSSEPSYEEDIFDDLSSRLEVPDPRNRWDSPLFTASTEEPASVTRAVEDAAAAMTEVRDSRSTRPAAAELSPTCATSNPPLSSTNLLAEIDAAAQEVVAAIVASQSGPQQTGAVNLGADLPCLELTRAIPLAELRRHKRGFLKLATKNYSSRLTDTRAAKRLFAEYLASSLSDS